MEALINYLLQFGHLNQQQIDLVLSKTKEIEIKKEGYFSEAGKVPREVGFLKEGVLRVYYYNDKGEEITKYFLDENNLIVDINSYMQNIPSPAYVQAVTDARLSVFSKEAMEALSLTVNTWDGIINQIITRSLAEKVNRLSPMLAENATARYLSFLEKFPMLANRIPLSFMASYLGITQSSLSRIRKNVSR